MATATVVSTYIEAGHVCTEVAVDEGERDANNRPVLRSYTGRVPLTPEFEALTNAQKRAQLIAAVKAVRDAQKTPPASAPSITGSVSI